ncbi:TPA: hypothetical protein H1009_02535 [archaeon]|nr:hypothetical protein [Candidatus Naiadarchaeales archaeon SRR2090153.bin461]
MATISDIFNDFHRHVRELVSATVKSVQAKASGKPDYSEFESALSRVQADLAKLKAEVYK